MNGKVRIYELSRELNLDNKEILDVCEQLNIPVKSHSSTISEAEATRIRSAAEKYVHTSPSPGKSTSTHSMPPSKSSGAQPPVKKQQILEVRRHRPTVEAPRRPEAQVPSASPSVSPVDAVPPQATQPTSPPARPSSSSSATRPTSTAPELEPSDVRQDLVEAVETPIESAPPLAEPLPEALPVAQSVEPEVQATQEPGILTQLAQSPDSLPNRTPEILPETLVEPAPIEPKAAKSGAKSAAKAVEPLPLVGPPVKPASRIEGGSTVIRPVLKKASSGNAPVSRSEPAPARTPGEGQGIIRRSPAARAEMTPSGHIPITEMSEPPVLRSKPVIELRHKPVRPTTESRNVDSPAAPIKPGSPGFGAAAEDPKAKPTPPKMVKRGKGWEEEEEQEESAKAAKGTTKAKRRTVVDEDEDIDLDEILDEDGENGEVSPTAISLSLMRPPKPKGRPGQAPKPVAAVPAPSRKKPGSSSESRFSRRDRREQDTPQKAEMITLIGGLSVSELASRLMVPDTEIIRALFMKGIMTSVNQILDVPTATMVAEEMGVLVETGVTEAEAKKVIEMISAGDLEHLQRRPPVVTIMGHVDHGKTTLLDSIRKTKVAQGEAGGITQHIGAYHVDVVHNGKPEQVVFLDTPGHEAFTAMRARGARVTDIAVLVVAADDGVRPQTIEAISHAKAAQVPIVIAINKIDKEGAQPDRVKQELTEYGLVAEEWGGDTVMVPVSALTGDNLETLLEMILLVSEVEDLYANPDRPAKGTVIEANLDKSRGPVATLLIQNGTLRVGDTLVAGSSFGKVRAMIDDRGARVDVASPSFAVEVLGLSDVPAAGDEFDVYLDEKEARAIAGNRADEQRLSRLQQSMASRRVSLNTLSVQAQEGDPKELNLLIKSDVQGSLEAIVSSLQQLPQKEVQVRVLLAAPGEITETDVDLAAASNAVIIGFNTTFASGARYAADQAGVDVRDYSIIYKLLEDVQGAMEGLLEPEMVEEPLGQLEVRAVFAVGKGAVAGCYVQSGKAIRNCKARVRRKGELLYTGTLDSLKRMKEDAKEVNAGYECGIGLDDFKDWQEGDIIETYRLITKRRTLSA